MRCALQLIEVLRKPEPVKQPSATDEAVKAAINNTKKQKMTAVLVMMRQV
jgi:hypothetical protein